MVHLRGRVFVHSHSFHKCMSWLGLCLLALLIAACGDSNTVSLESPFTATDPVKTAIPSLSPGLVATAGTTVTTNATGRSIPATTTPAVRPTVTTASQSNLSGNGQPLLLEIYPGSELLQTRTSPKGSLEEAIPRDFRADFYASANKPAEIKDFYTRILQAKNFQFTNQPQIDGANTVNAFQVISDGNQGAYIMFMEEAGIRNEGLNVAKINKRTVFKVLVGRRLKN